MPPRLMQIAQAGEALVSGEFYTSIRHLVPPTRVESLGLVTLRGRADAGLLDPGLVA